MLEKIVRKDFKKVDKNDRVSKVFGYLYGEAPFPIVFDGKKPWGVIDERRLIKSKLSGDEKVKDFVVGVPKLDATYSLIKAKDRMKKSGVDVIIVTKEGEILGYVTAIDIAKESGIDKKAGDLMREVEPINEEDEIGDAINLMRKRNERILPVLSNKKFAGFIGVRNILKLLTTHEKVTDYHQEKTSLLEAPVKGYMEVGVKVCSPLEDGEKVADLIEEQGFAVVCKGKEYMGIIEPADLLK